MSPLGEQGHSQDPRPPRGWRGAAHCHPCPPLMSELRAGKVSLSCFCGDREGPRTWGPRERQSWGPRVSGPRRARPWSDQLMSGLETEAQSGAHGAPDAARRLWKGLPVEGGGCATGSRCQQTEKKVRWAQQRPRRGRSRTGLAALQGAQARTPRLERRAVVHSVPAAPPLCPVHVSPRLSFRPPRQGTP